MDNKNKDSVIFLKLNNHVKPRIIENKSRNMVFNGKNNDYFYYVNDRHIGSPTNSAINNGYCRLIYGQGLAAYNQNKKPLDWVTLKTVLSPKDLKSIIKDFQIQGMAYIQVIKSKGNTLNSMQHISVEKIAPEIANEYNDIKGYWYCNDWKRQNVEGNEPVYIPAFGTSNEGRELYCIKPYQMGREYFALPSYQSGLQYAELEEEISNFLISHMKNGMSAGYVVNIPNGQNFTVEQKQEIERQIKQQLTGSNNAGNFILNFAFGEEKITVEVLEISDAHDKWQFSSNEAQNKILVSHEVVSPLLFGIKDASGFSSNADELDMAETQTLKRVIKPKQTEIIDALKDILLYYNIDLDLYFKPLTEPKETIIEEQNTELSKHKIELESYTDYPQGATNNAKRALEWAEKNGWGSCGTPVGKTRANQLAKREPISLDTVKRMAQFKRHQQHKDVPYSEGCGGLMWDAWGGDSGIRWAQTKLKELGLSIDLKSDKDPEPERADYLISLGEDIPEDWIELENRTVNSHSLTEDKLNNIFQLARLPKDSPKAKSKQDTSLFKIRYQYKGNQNPQREFCKKLIKANKVYTKEALDKASSQPVNKGFGVNGSDTYDIFLYKGGVNCKHFWERKIFLKSNNEQISVNQARKMILELDPEDRKEAMWEQNPKEVAQIASPSNNFWKVN